MQNSAARVLTYTKTWQHITPPSTFIGSSSLDMSLLTTLHTSLQTFGDGAFSVASPTLWSSLLAEIQTLSKNSGKPPCSARPIDFVNSSISGKYHYYYFLLLCCLFCLPPFVYSVLASLERCYKNVSYYCWCKQGCRFIVGWRGCRRSKSSLKIMVYL